MKGFRRIRGVFCLLGAPGFAGQGWSQEAGRSPLSMAEAVLTALHNWKPEEAWRLTDALLEANPDDAEAQYLAAPCKVLEAADQMELMEYRPVPLADWARWWRHVLMAAVDEDVAGLKRPTDCTFVANGQRLVASLAGLLDGQQLSSTYTMAETARRLCEALGVASPPLREPRIALTELAAAIGAALEPGTAPNLLSPKGPDPLAVRRSYWFHPPRAPGAEQDRQTDGGSCALANWPVR